MNIFGFNITRPAKLIVVEDRVPEVRVVIPDTKKPTTIPRQKDPTLGYHAQRRAGRGAFQTPEYDLSEIGRIADTDSYVRQAFDKKTALMFKEGWDLVGKNPKTIKYIKARFAQISQASSTPTEQLFRMIGAALIRKSNAFVVKARKTEASGGRIRREAGSKVDIKPVAGYFIAPAETMEFRLSGHKLQRWRQRMPDGEIKEWNPRDVAHVYAAKKEGFVFGTPLTVPVVDDIRALRKIEENIELLVYQHLFPLFQYKVGTETMPAGLTEEGEREIDLVRREIQYMPTEGGIVTPERHEITAIGAEGRALRAESYLDHFKKRVLSGLGVSSVDMGEGETSNRACYSENTQTLTDSGFKYYWGITPEDRIGTYNPESNEIEFHKPNGDILLYDYEGDMIHFQNRNVDVMVTPDHDMWMGRPRNNQGLTWEKVHAEDINIHQFKFLSGGIDWEGVEPEDFLLPYVPYNCHSEVPNPGPFSRINIYDWLEFLGYYVSEGTLAKVKGKWAVSISQNSRVNPDKTQKIRECLERLPFKFNEYTDPGDQTTRFWISCKSLYLYLEEVCGDYSYKKQLPHEILSYKADLLEHVFEAMMLGDGSSDTREGRTSRTYYSKSDILIDQVQEIAIKLGYRAHVLPGSRCKRVSISIGECSNVTQDYVNRVKYNGKVYCYNIPNHLFITRRNGRIGIHGNTADNMSRNLIDSVKDYQQVMEIFVNEYIIKELLLESTFGDSVLDEDSLVRMKFKEIDVDSQIKKETNTADLFNKDLIGWDEARRRIGFEPIIVPSREEVEAGTDTAENYPEWSNTRWKLFEEPKLLIQSIDEPYSPAAKAAAANNSLSVTEKGNQEAGKQRNEQEVQLEKEKTKAKVAVAKAKPAPKSTTKKDGFLETTFIQVKKDIVKHVSQTQRLDHNWVASLIRAQMSTTVDRLISQQIIEFRNGYAQWASVESEQFAVAMSHARSLLRERAERFITRLTENIITSLKRNVKIDTEDMTAATRAVFEAVQFRARFIEDVEVRKARNLGVAFGTRDKGGLSLTSFTQAGNDIEPCAKCMSKNGVDVNLQFVTLDDVPPHHAGCNCNFGQSQLILDFGNVGIKDGTPGSADNPDNLPDTVVQPCPECGKTAIATDAPNGFKCKACNHKFVVIKEQDIEEVDDKSKRSPRSTSSPKSKGAARVKCIQRAKARISSRHTDWNQDKVRLAAEAACEHLLDMAEEVDENLEDVTLEEY